MLAVQLVLAGWLVVAGLSLLRPSLSSALVLAALSALWLPVNNGQLEGPILYKVAAHHGLTAADLLTYVGLALAAVAGWRRRRAWLRAKGPARGAVRWTVTAAFLAALLLLLGCGLAASWFEHRPRHHRVGPRAAGSGLAIHTAQPGPRPSLGRAPSPADAGGRSVRRPPASSRMS